MEYSLKVLLNTYWATAGWKDGTISQEEFEIARREGYMFHYPDYQSHEETLSRLLSVLKQVSPADVANAFLYSLSTRKLEYRSALGSCYYGVAVPKHDLYTMGSQGIEPQSHCVLCGWQLWKKHPTDYDLKHGLNVYNFERYKFGGVRHTSLNYALFDLEQFIKLEKVIPVKEDW